MTESDLLWADLILVMERKYEARIRALFPDSAIPAMRALDIPDDYESMDADLIELLEAAIDHELEKTEAQDTF